MTESTIFNHYGVAIFSQRMNDSMNLKISDNAVYGTAPATPDLFGKQPRLQQVSVIFSLNAEKTEPGGRLTFQPLTRLPVLAVSSR